MAPSTPERSRSRRGRSGPTAGARAAVALAALGAVAGCADVTPAFGPDPAQARTAAVQLFGGLAASFAPNTYDTRYGTARQRFSENFLAPTALFADTSLWSAREGDTRLLHSRAVFTGASYDQVALPTPPPLPVALGESRHRMSLRRLGDGRFAWDARVEWALGPGRAALAEALPGRLALSAGQAPEPAWTLALPRASRALARLLTVDTIRADRARDGTALVTYVVRFVPERTRRDGFPELAGFIERFIGRSAFDLALQDARGARWMEAVARDRRIRVRLRVAPDGTLAPLLGAGARLPDSLALVGSLYARGGWAGVAIDDVRADFTLQRSGARRGFVLRWRTEPRWGFPFSVDRLIAASLRAPFEGDGIVVEFGAEDGPAGQLLLVRRFAGQFQETRLVRWMGALAGSVFGAWTGRVEPDAHRFLHETFTALRDDLSADRHRPAPPAN